MAVSTDDSIREPLFSISDLPEPKTTLSTALIDEADALLQGTFRCFGRYSCFYGTPPDWFLNPFNQKHFFPIDKHWAALGEFDSTSGDIKCIWEISRFDWVLILTRAYRQTGKKEYIATANTWVSDWYEKNPLNRGPNWKCGQEVAIRMMQVLLAAFILSQQKKPTKGLIRFVQEHAARIAPTIRYAISQDNNHGTSESAALFIAGAWLLSLQNDGVDRSQAGRWLKMGRRLLENRMAHLIGKDGSFSQYSVNYHRVMLDTISQVEFWRMKLGERPFAEAFYQKAQAATKWLFCFTNTKTGKAPNIGANDGARLFNLSENDFRDFRPSVQLASRLFYGIPAFRQGDYDEALSWLEVEFDEAAYTGSMLEKDSMVFADGGYCYLTKGNIDLYVRFPHYRFRPGHADALHLDIWYDGINLIRDGGTYSYNTDGQWLSYFPGTEAHSTVQFDRRDQMVRISRFLFGNWLRTGKVSSISNIDGSSNWAADYKDYKGACHRRQVALSSNKVVIRDTINDFAKSAIVRWRLLPVVWILEGKSCVSSVATIHISSNPPCKRIELASGLESVYYLEKNTLPVLEVEVEKPSEIITEILFHQQENSVN